jgi:hypothetical protein
MGRSKYAHGTSEKLSKSLTSRRINPTARLLTRHQTSTDGVDGNSACGRKSLKATGN